MPEQKPTPNNNKPKKDAKSAPPVDLKASRRERIEKYTVKPEFWENLMDALPDWGDEVLGIVLLVFGFVSFLAIFDVSSNAPLARAWSDVLTGLFGYGSLIVSAGLFALGVIIFLPKFGVNVRFPAHRVLALEIGFIAVLALLHLSAGDSEFRAIARAGQGGGIVGGAMSSVVAGLLGTTTAIVIFSVLLVVCVAVAGGVRRTQITGWLARNSRRLYTLSERIDKETRTAQGMNATRTPAQARSTGRAPVNIVRIRPDRANLPPSLREIDRDLPPLGLDEPKGENLSPEELALFMRPEDKPFDMSTIGNLLKGQKDSRGWQLIQRPDGRVKRYFSVDHIREARRAPKRDKNLPSLDVLMDAEIVPPDEEEINHNVILIENTLLEFDIDIDVIDVKVGPTVTQYAVQPFASTDDDNSGSARTRLSKIASYASDLALSLSVKRLRLETPVPGQRYMGIEVPNKQPSIVALRSVYESKAFSEQLAKAKSPLYIPLGRDVSGAPIGIDLATCPHLLIAGTTGSGKSVCITAIAITLMMENTPDMVKLVMMDPKMVELVRFNGVPHLLGPVETELDRIVEVLRWCTREMDRRYKVLEENAARNISDYNARLGQRRRKEFMPYIVIMIDEIGDLMLTKPEETEASVTRLAQMARAVGMHLVVATQRPSTDVITGLIKANFPTRIAFSVASGIDSRVILDTIGAETLLGKGDMLYLAQDAAGPKRLQGCFVSDDEVRQIVAHWQRWKHEEIQAGRLERQRIGPWERGLTRREFLAETDPMLEEAIELVIKEQEASASLIQRRLGLGYPRAARIMDLLAELGIIGETLPGGRNRKVLIKPGQDPFKDALDDKLKNR